MLQRVGGTAPDFSVRAADGSDFQLAKLRGSPVLLTFYRYASCPLCNVRIHELLGRWKEYAKRGLRGVAVFQSQASNVNMFMARHDAPFVLVPDAEETFYALYGLGTSLAALLAPSNLGRLVAAHKMGFKQGKTEGTLTRLPADFLIDKDGILRTVHYGRALSDHLPFEMIDDFLKSYS